MNVNLILILIQACSLFAGLSEAIKLLPKRIQCVSQVYNRRNDVYSKIDRYLTEEFTDRPRGRSSIELYQVGQQTTQIFYNQLNSDDLYREFVSYDVNNNNCQTEKIYQWPLSAIRQTVIWIVPNERLTRDICDISLGPTSLLIAIEETRNQYKFVTKAYDKHILSNTDIYRRVVKVLSLDVSLLVSVTVRSHGPIKNTDGRTLASAYASDKKVDFVSVEICHVQSGKIVAGKPYECVDMELQVRVDYLKVSEMALGSLVGTSLRQSSQYEFQRDPFMRPVGIGCWDQKTTGVGFQRLQVPTSSFSGHFGTELGTRDSGYVAYDADKQLLRLDRNERKNIYDLDSGRSFHSALYAQSTKQKPSGSGGKNCIALESQSKFIPVANALEHLLGFGGGQTSNAAYHLGSKMIDHVMHKVYEAKLGFDSSLGGVIFPLLLEVPVLLDKANQYFVTYYITEFKSANSSVQPIIRFMEMWELHVASNRRHLINRLSFGEFDWSLEVEPQVDTEGHSPGAQVFTMNSCSLERSGQLDMHFALTLTDPSQSIHWQELAKSAKLRQVETILHTLLHDRLDISPLNVNQLSAQFDPHSGNVIVDAKIVELMSGLTSDEVLFYGRYGHLQEAFADSLLLTTMNRHTLDECRLDSLTLSDSPNVLIYCQSKTTCMLVTEESVKKFKGNKSGGADKTATTAAPENDGICEAHRFKWGPGPVKPVDSVLNKVLGSQYRLSNSKVDVPMGSNKTLKMHTTLPQIKLIDSIRLINGGQDLADLRFMTHSEDDMPTNSNLPVKLERKSDLLHHCQMACQFDPFCESFSVCTQSKRQAIKPTDCVLSPIRLSPQVVDEIEMKARVRNSSGFVIVELPEEANVAAFKLQRENSCSLHPKDALITFKMSAEFKGKLTDDKEPPSKLGERVSLEDCAHLAHERSLWQNPYEAQFYYCPIDDLCIVDPDMTKHLLVGQNCYHYTKSHELFYTERVYSRMSVHLDKLDDGASRKPISSKDKLEELQIGHWIEGVNREQCARDCSLHHSRCLNFDTCRFYKKSSMTNEFSDLCVIYSVRDPSQRINTKLGLLPQEERFYSLNASKPSASSLHFSGNMACSHLSLHDFYLDLRLRQMLNDLKPQSADDLRDKAGRDKFNQIEQSIIDKDLEQSRADLEEMQKRYDDQQSRADRAAHSSGHLNAILFIAGLLMGSLAMVYGSLVMVAVGDKFRWLHAKIDEQRNSRRRLSQLTLGNHLEL